MKSRLVICTVSGHLACHGTTELPDWFRARFETDPFGSLRLLEEGGQFWLHRLGRPGCVMVEVTTDDFASRAPDYRLAGLGLIETIDGTVCISAAEYAAEERVATADDSNPRPHCNVSDLTVDVEPGKYRLLFYQREPQTSSHTSLISSIPWIQRVLLTIVLVASHFLAISAVVQLFIGPPGNAVEPALLPEASSLIGQIVAASIVGTTSAFLLFRLFWHSNTRSTSEGWPPLRQQGVVWGRADVVIVLHRIGSALA